MWMLCHSILDDSIRGRSTVLHTYFGILGSIICGGQKETGGEARDSLIITQITQNMLK